MLINNLNLLLKGFIVTLELWAVSSIVSILFGILTGIIRSNKLRVAVISPILDFITMIFRGVPLYTQLMIFYFVMPELLGLNISSFISGVIALGICSGSYTSEIVRGAINALPDTQWDASKMLGYSILNQLKYIIFPQAFKIALPSFVNEYVMVLKSTSMIASIGVLELTKVGINIISRSLDPIPISIAIGLIYLLASSAFGFIGQALERRYDVSH